MENKRYEQKSAMQWLASLYFLKGLPYVVLMTVSLVLFRQLGLSNGETAFYTSWFYLPWVLKPLWQPYVTRTATRRRWILITEILMGASLGGVAFTLPTHHCIQSSLALLWLTAFSCAVHNQAADNLFTDKLGTNHGILYWARTVFYRLATFVAQGILVMIAGNLQVVYRGSISYSWSLVFYGISALLVMLWVWHGISLPSGTTIPRQTLPRKLRDAISEVEDTTKLFFRKPHAMYAVLFLLLFKLPEGLLSKVSVLFLIDSAHHGGLGLSPQEYGLVSGTIGVAGLSLGGMLGAMALSHGGLRRWLWPMAFAMSLPNVVYLYLCHALPDNIFAIALCLFIEQLGYGFGFVVYITFMKRFAAGYLQRPHLTLGKSFMALSMMIPAMVSGWLQAAIGYQAFFVIAVCSGIITLGVTWLVTGVVNETTDELRA